MLSLFSSWGDWGLCDTVCGPGLKNRTAKVMFWTDNQLCDITLSYVKCHTKNFSFCSCHSEFLPQAFVIAETKLELSFPWAFAEFKCTNQANLVTHTICPDIPPKIVALKILFTVADVEYLVLCMECFYQERFMTPCCICICTQFQSSYKCICICIGVPVSVACSVCARLGPYWVDQHKGHHQSQHDQTICAPACPKINLKPFQAFQTNLWSVCSS